MTLLHARTLLPLALVGAAVFACSGPAAGEFIFTGGDVKVGADTDGDDDDNRAPSSSSSSSGAAGGADAFFGNLAYEYKTVIQNANDRTTGAHAAEIPLGGKECAKAGCHLDAGPKWAISGTVFSAKTGGTGVAKVQVGLRIDNKVTEVFTDANGHFFLKSDIVPPAGATVAVRKEGGKSTVMVTPLPAAPLGGNCNAPACHGSTNQIYVE